jgi:hypothetical protein
LGVVCEVFFFAATSIAGLIFCAIPAMAAPSAGSADACEANVNETADAATKANKVIFICFLLDDVRAPEHRTRRT